MKAIVHICCAPDSIYFLEKLKKDFPQYEWIGFFYDPNIHPKEEYDLRFIETKRVCDRLDIPLIEGKYDDTNWFLQVNGLEKEPEKGRRCEVCFDIRLKESFDLAKDIDASAITTTLLMSPKKSLNQINLVASYMSLNYGIEFINVDYRKNGGVQKMHELVKTHEIYSQDYCGCIYGLFNEEKDLYNIMPDVLFEWAKMMPGSKQEWLFIKRLKLLAETKGFYTKEIPFSFIGWDILRGYLFADEEPIKCHIKYYSKSTNGIAKAKIDNFKNDTIYLNKQNIKIIFENRYSYEADTTFIIDRVYKDKILKASKIKAFVKSQISYKDSLILLIYKRDFDNIKYIKTFKTYKHYFEEETIPYFEEMDDDVAFAIVGAFDFGGYDKLLEYIDGKKIFDNSWPLCDRVL